MSHAPVSGVVKVTTVPKIKKLNASGAVNPVNGDTVQLVPGDVVTSKITVPKKSTITISGTGDFVNDIVLADSTSILKIDLHNKLKVDIVLNSGTVFLSNDLKFATSCTFIGNGIVDVNGLQLKFAKNCLPKGQITYLNANDIILEGNTDVSSPQIFSGPSLSSDVSGFGFFWNFTSGGCVQVGEDHTLYLVGLHVKNFGHQSSHGYFDIHATSSVVMQNCTLELTGNYVHDQGTIIFSGDNNKIIGHDYTFTTSGAAQLIVDGVSLTYDSLDRPNRNPFVFTSPMQQRKFLNNGLIRSVYTSPGLNIDSNNPVFSENYFLTENSVLHFKNTTPSIPKGVLLDCSGYTICFPKTANDLFNLDKNVTVTVENVVLLGYQKDVVGYADATSKLVFGKGAQLHVLDNVSLSSADRALTFVGDASICGAGTRLELDASNRIVVGPDCTLTLKNLKLVLKSADAIECLANSSKVVFENCSITLDSAGLEWSLGNIDISGIVEIFGGDTSTVDHETTFIFSTAGNLKILSGSNLVLDRGIIFKYQANPVLDGGLLYNQKRHLKMTDPTSAITLNGATLHSTATAFALDYGRLIVDDISTLKIDGNLFLGTDVELGSSLIIIVRPCAIFDIQGHVGYNKTTFP